MSACRSCGYEADYSTGQLRLVNMLPVAIQGQEAEFECKAERECALRAELRDVKEEINDLRARILDVAWEIESEGLPKVTVAKLRKLARS